jgi:hypothetical protein
VSTTAAPRVPVAPARYCKRGHDKQAPGAARPNGGCKVCRKELRHAARVGNVTDARVADALILAARYAGTRDPERLAWLLDQIIRTITTPDYYREWIASYETRGTRWHQGLEP